ncbi:MAG: hypothetical protein PHD60_10695 [Clostridia bacterium]|nr:hypothetical protein [Clostridia bacterium]
MDKKRAVELLEKMEENLLQKEEIKKQKGFIQMLEGGQGYSERHKENEKQLKNLQEKFLNINSMQELLEEYIKTLKSGIEIKQNLKVSAKYRTSISLKALEEQNQNMVNKERLKTRILTAVWKENSKSSENRMPEKKKFQERKCF